MAVRKKQEVKPAGVKTKEVKAEPVVVSDVVTETIEVIENINPQTAKSKVESPSQNNPLDDFKSKME